MVGWDTDHAAELAPARILLVQVDERTASVVGVLRQRAGLEEPADLEAGARNWTPGDGLCPLEGELIDRHHDGDFFPYHRTIELLRLRPRARHSPYAAPSLDARFHESVGCPVIDLTPKD